MASYFPARWCLQKMKRSLLLLCFTSTIFVLVSSVFLFLNSERAQSMARSLTNSKKANEDESRGPRGIVQYYPDNQNKYLFRKESPVAEHVIDNGPRLRKDQSYEAKVKSKVHREETTAKRSRDNARNYRNDGPLSYDVQVFYYPWYGTPEFDGDYYHWNHKYLDNWNKNDHKRYPTGRHDPLNNDVGANFYPKLGSYSSRDPKVMSDHMRQIRLSGAGVLSVSWYPPGLADENGLPSDGIIKPLLDEAHKHGLKVSLHIEPYQNLNVSNFREHLKYVRDTYSQHPAFYKRKVGNRELPIYYIYDSYRLKSEEWQRLFSRKGDLSVRDTDLDGVFIGLLVEFRHRTDIKKAKFDGFYTYFGANGFTHGSSWKNWKSLQDFAQRNSLLFIPSVGPGYVDTRIRAWNGQTTRDRRKGTYYDMAWRTALQASPKMVTITSFNEWHEGTQIEEAIPMKTKDSSFTYLSYEPNEPDFYLTETRNFIEKFITGSS